jgi:hypothetical protein
MKGGRPPMAPNRLSRKRAMQLCADKESPLDVMFDNMLFWHRQSRDLGARLEAIGAKIKNDDDRREAMSLARMFLSSRENVRRTAHPTCTRSCRRSITSTAPPVATSSPTAR